MNLMNVFCNKPMGKSLLENFKPIHEVLLLVNKISKSQPSISATLNHVSVPHSVIYNQLREIFLQVQKEAETFVKEKLGIKNEPQIYYTIEETRDNTNFELKFISQNLDDTEIISELFKYPLSFIKGNLPRISMVLTNFTLGEKIEEPQHMERIKGLAPAVRNPVIKHTSFKAPRNFLLQIAVTTNEISIYNYNFQEEFIGKLEKKLKDISEWSMRRLRLLQIVISDRISLGHTKFDRPEKKSITKVQGKKNELNFLNSLNQPYFKDINEHITTFNKQWIGVEYNKRTSNQTNEIQKTNHTKTIEAYASNLHMAKNFQKNLTDFREVEQKVKFSIFLSLSFPR